MLGLIVLAKGVDSGRETIMAYPYTLFKDYQTDFDRVHFNANLSAVSTQDHNEKILGFPPSVIADFFLPKKEL